MDLGNWVFNRQGRLLRGGKLTMLTCDKNMRFSSHLMNCSDGTKPAIEREFHIVEVAGND